MKRLFQLSLGLLFAASLAAAPSITPITNGKMKGPDNEVIAGATLTINGALVIGGGGSIGGVQTTDATLTALAGQTTAANKLTYWTGVDTAATIDFSPVSQTLMGYTTAAAWRDAIFPATAAEGDLITNDGTNWIRQAIGTTGQVLTAQADGTFAWDDFAPTVDAEDVAYDNATSGLTATDVQSAIDELEAAMVTLTGTQTLTNKTLTAPIIGTISNTGTLTLPTATDTLVGRATTDTLTNKSIAGSQLTGAYTASGLTMATARLLGRNTASTGAVEEITLGTGLSFSGTTLNSTGGFSNPMTTAEDLIVGGSSGTPARLAKGSDGQVLKVVSGSLAWDTDSTGSGSLPGSPTTGDLTYYDGADWVSLPVDSDGKVLKLASGLPTWGTDSTGGGSGGSKTLAVFKPRDAEFPASDYATLYTRNNRSILQFDPTTQETAYFPGIIPEATDLTGGLTFFVRWAAETATSGTIGWDVSVERITASGLDIDSDSFSTAQTITAATVSGTSGITSVTSVTISQANLPASLAAGDMYRVRVRRDVANDTATGDAELLTLEVQLP